MTDSIVCFTIVSKGKGIVVKSYVASCLSAIFEVLMIRTYLENSLMLAEGKKEDTKE